MTREKPRIFGLLVDHIIVGIVVVGTTALIGLIRLQFPAHIGTQLEKNQLFKDITLSTNGYSTNAYIISPEP